MGWTFRKSFRIAPGVRLNLGKRSVGVSGGPRGVTASANSRGQRGVSAGASGFRWWKRWGR